MGTQATVNEWSFGMWHVLKLLELDEFEDCVWKDSGSCMLPLNC